MNNTYFFDTSGVIKLYHQEIGTSCVEAIFSDKTSTIIISELSTVEFHSAVAKKIRTKEISEYAGEQAIKNFHKDYVQRFLVSPLSSRIIRKAKELIDKHGNKSEIRTLDALQLSACLLEEGDNLQFVSGDVRLNRVCRLEKVRVINPETEDLSSE